MKKFISLILTIMMIFSAISIPHTAYAGAGIDYQNAKSLNDRSFYYGNFGNELLPQTYSFTAERTNYYRFTVENESVEYRVPVYTDAIASTALNLANAFHGKIQFQVYDSREKLLGERYVKCGYDGSVTLKLNAGEKYYIIAKAIVTVNGNYSIGVKEIPDFGGNTWREANEIQIGTLISSIDVTDDIDWFKFETDSNNSYYNFSFENISCSDTLRLFVYEYVEGAGENPLREIANKSISKGNTTNFDLNLKTNTLYLCKTYASYDEIGGYQLDIVQNEDGIGNSLDTAYKDFGVNKKLESSIDGSYDVDYIRFETDDVDSFYYVSGIAKSSQLYITICDDKGNEIRKQYLNTINDKFTQNIKLNNNSTYYLKVFAPYDYITDYEIELTKKVNTFKDTFSEANNVTINKTYKSAIDGSNDIDVVKFTANQKGFYTIKYTKYYQNSYLNFDLYDESYNLVKESYTYSNYGQTSIKLDAGEVCYIRIFSGSNDYFGNYDFKITVEADEASDEMEEAKFIKTNTAVSGGLQSRDDVDWYKITLNSSKEYRFSLTSESGDRVYLSVYNRYGKELFYIETYDYYIVTKTLNSGTYFIKIKAPSNSYSDYKNYYKFKIATCGSNHSYGNTVITKRATFSSEGSYTQTCTVCKEATKTTEIPRIGGIDVSSTSFVYNGNKRVPALKPYYYQYYTYGSKYSISSSNYTIEYFDSSNRKITTPKNVGKYKAKITFKNRYQGSKTFSFVINPKGTTISKLTAIKGGFKATIKKNTTQTTGYQIKYSKYSDMSNSRTVTMSNNTSSKTIKNLAKRQKYYVQIRTYKTVNGTKFYSSWSGKKSITTKK